MIIQHRRGTTGDWKKADLLSEQLFEVILKDGEFAIEECTDGSYKVRVGDGKTKFFELPYIDARAEAEAASLVQKAKNELENNLKSFKAEQHTVIENTKQTLLNSIAQQAVSLSEAYKADDILLKTELDAKISEVSTLQKQLAKDVSDNSSALESLGTKLTKTENTLADQTAANTNQFKSVNAELKELATTIEEQANEFNASLAEQKSYVDTEIQGTKTKLEEAISTSLASTRTDLEKAITDASTAQNDKLYAVKNTLSSQILANKTSCEKTLTDLRSVLEEVEQTLTDNLAYIDKRDNAAIALILEELTDLRANIEQLGETDNSLIDKLYAINNTLTGITNRLTSEVSALNVTHEADITGIITELRRLDASQKAADTDIVSTMQEYISDIYAELVDLVDDDIVIIEKVYSVANTLSSRLATVEKNLTTTISRVDEADLALATELADTRSALSTDIQTNTEDIDKLEQWRNALTNDDLGIQSQFVTAVKQADGKITVERTRPTAADIEYHGSNVSKELDDRATHFADFSSRCVQLNNENGTLYVGEDADNSIILYCGNATEI
jgi:hypothetical protein